jgi:murein DD-endopeptidase MepM/ murein hydrolase activator NlpD
MTTRLWRPRWMVGAILSMIAVYPLRAQERFPTLPFNDPGVFIGQGWLYDSPGPHLCSEAEGGDGCHKEIDYFKGSTGAWESFKILAAAPGWAVASRSTSAYGHFVYIAHEARDGRGLRYFTLYAHLKSWNVPLITIDELSADIEANDFSSWKRVVRGDVIGEAGDDGVPGVIHLHFEVQPGGYPDNKTDAYDIYGEEGGICWRGVRSGLSLGRLPAGVFSRTSARRAQRVEERSVL